MRGLFITGTGTDVGKTFVTALVARQLVSEGVRVGIYKPVCSGAILDERGRHPQWHDVETHFDALGGQFPREVICPQCFLAPAAPPVAAADEAKRVDTGLLRTGLHRWRDQADLLLVEGAGGWLSPISESDAVADLAAELRFPVLVVADIGLGTINTTLLTVESIRARGLTAAGVILNAARPPTETLAERTNPQELRARCPAPILSEVAWNQHLWLRETDSGRTIDWSAIAAASE